MKNILKLSLSELKILREVSTEYLNLNYTISCSFSFASIHLISEQIRADFSSKNILHKAFFRKFEIFDVYLSFEYKFGKKIVK